MLFIFYLIVDFSWLSPLLYLGHNRRLEESDLYSVLPEDGSEILGEELQRYCDQLRKEEALLGNQLFQG